MPHGILLLWVFVVVGFIFFKSGIDYLAPGLLVTNGVHLSQRMTGILVHMWAGLVQRALNSLEMSLGVAYWG